MALTDFDNDGDLDLFEAKGRVVHTPGPLERDDVFAEPNELYEHVNGRFELVEPTGGTLERLVHTSRDTRGVEVQRGSRTRGRST